MLTVPMHNPNCVHGMIRLWPFFLFSAEICCVSIQVLLFNNVSGTAIVSRPLYHAYRLVFNPTRMREDYSGYYVSVSVTALAATIDN